MAVALVALGALRARRDRLARAAVALLVVALVWGWASRSSRASSGRADGRRAAASPPELHAIAIALAAGTALLAPSLLLLYGAFRRTPPEVHP